MARRIAALLMLLTAACTAAGLDTTAPDTTAMSTPPPTVTTTTAAPTTTTTDPATQPETISTLSRLGRMTWRMYDLEFMVTHVGSYGDGYVALLYPSLAHRPEFRGIADPGTIATSTDGVLWTPLAEQPGEPESFTAQVLAVDDDRLVVLGRPYGDSGVPDTNELTGFVWDGAGWEELPVQIPVGSLTRGGELDVGYLADGTPLFLGRGGSAWHESAGGFSHQASAIGRWPNFLTRFDTIEVWPEGSAVTLPNSTLAAVIEYEGRFVAAATPGSGGQAWTSTDGHTWQPIAPIAAPWGPSGDTVVSPEAIDAGGLGWVAVGAWSGRGALWVSADGVTWGHLTEIPGPAGWDPRIPWPPAIVVDNERALIYGRAYDAILPDSASMVWVGTVES